MQFRTDDDRIFDKTSETAMPLLAEGVAVSKQIAETARVQVARVTREREQLIEELLAHETVDRTPIGRRVETMPAIKEEGDTISDSDRRGSARNGVSSAPKRGGARPARAVYGNTPEARNAASSRSGRHAVEPTAASPHLSRLEAEKSRELKHGQSLSA